MGTTKVDVCHIPPGNPDNAHTITVGAPAVEAHLAHGDFVGSCDGSEEPPAEPQIEPVPLPEPDPAPDAGVDPPDGGIVIF